MRRSTLLLAALLQAALMPAHADSATAGAAAPDFVHAKEAVHGSPAAQERVRQHILAFEAGNSGRPAAMQRLVAPDGQRFYFLRSPCCDQFDPLYDASGRYVCSPSGGFTGRGSGRCPAWVRQQLWGPPVSAAASAAQ